VKGYACHCAIKYKLTIDTQRYFDAAKMTNLQHRFVVGSIGKA
jgi:hypothetical protein